MTGVGCLKIDIPNGKDNTSVTLKDILYFPELGYTLVSLAKCDTAGFIILLKDKTCCIKDPKGIQMGRIPQYQGLYWVDNHSTANISAYMGVRVYAVDKLHRKMSHISPVAIKWLVEQKTILGLELDMKSKPTFCPTCAKAKPMHKLIPQEWVQYVSHVLRNKIHLDVWGPASPWSYNGKLYYINFTDDFTRWTMIYFIKQKLDISKKYKEYEAWLKTQYGKPIKVLQSDRGGEYLSNEFTRHLKEKGMMRSLTIHDTPEENRVAEWLNWMLLEHMHAMLMTAQLPKNLWPETSTTQSGWGIECAHEPSMRRYPLKSCITQNQTLWAYLTGAQEFAHWRTAQNSWIQKPQKDIG